MQRDKGHEHVPGRLRDRIPEFRAIVRLAPLDVRRPDLSLAGNTPANLTFMRGVLEKVGRLLNPVGLSSDPYSRSVPEDLV
jgi:hypothetical protein